MRATFRRFRLLPLLILVLLPALVIGGGGFLVYQYFLKPKHQTLQQDRAAVTPEKTPVADPLQKPFEQAGQSIQAGQLAAAREQLLKALTNPPASKLVPEMRSLLGELNLTLFLNDSSDPRRTPYTVASGDTVVAIAKRFKCTQDIVVLLNALPGVNLRKGQDLLVPKCEFSLAIDPENREVILLSDGYFFKSYPMAESRFPPSHKGAFESKVSKKFSWKANAQVAFGQPEYVDAARWISLTTPGYSIFTQQTEQTRDIAPPGTGCSMQPGDIDEIFGFIVPGATATVLN